MGSFRQAKWDEPLIFELSRRGKKGYDPPTLDDEERGSFPDPEGSIPDRMRRKEPPSLPEVSEGEVLRHFIRLSQQNYCIDLGIYPLGSCTMKYNPKVCEAVASSPKLAYTHPYQDERFCQGTLRILYELSALLAEITGMEKFSLQPAAGAQAEFLGVLIMRAYNRDKGGVEERREVIVPDSAHGTNPASASMGGFRTVVVPSGEDGMVDMEALKATVGKRTAGIMITNPNTLGIFESRIEEIAEVVHEAGGLVYYDGANLNAILGKSRPGDFGADMVHVNLHKTFSIPHGGGGPGAGPLGVKKGLEDYLSKPTIEFDGQRYYLNYDRPKSVGMVRLACGNTAHLVRAYTYILSLGGEGLERVAEIAVLNANYVMKNVLKSGGYSLPYPGTDRMHECVLSAEPLLESGVRALDVCKALLDYGLHAPSMYFPQNVREALMIEPTETESMEELDKFVEAMVKVARDAKEEHVKVTAAPTRTSIGRVDEVKASHPRTMTLSWRREGSA